jgi:hypothetical protein
MITDDADEKDALTDEEMKLQQVEKDANAIENRDHHGFADAINRIRIEREIQELDTDILHRKQESSQG